LIRLSYNIQYSLVLSRFLTYFLRYYLLYTLKYSHPLLALLFKLGTQNLDIERRVAQLERAYQKGGKAAMDSILLISATHTEETLKKNQRIRDVNSVPRDFTMFSLDGQLLEH